MDDYMDEWFKESNLSVVHGHPVYSMHPLVVFDVKNSVLHVSIPA